MITKQQYLQWQKQLVSDAAFRRFWRFWSNYAFIFFIPAFLWVATQNFAFQTIIMSAIAFFVARGVAVTVINLFYHRPRPYQTYKFEPITSRFFSWKTKVSNSFPSRHTASYAAVAFAIFMMYPEAGIWLMGVTVVTGVARVILGFHYPSDVVAGYFLGALIGILTVFLLVPTLFT